MGAMLSRTPRDDLQASQNHRESMPSPRGQHAFAVLIAAFDVIARDPRKHGTHATPDRALTGAARRGEAAAYNGC